jgi:hypothetical protein
MATNAVFYFSIPVDVSVLLIDGGADVPTFASQWKGMDESFDVSKVIKGLIISVFITFMYGFT